MHISTKPHGQKSNQAAHSARCHYGFASGSPYFFKTFLNFQTQLDASFTNARRTSQCRRTVIFSPCITAMCTNMPEKKHIDATIKRRSVLQSAAFFALSATPLWTNAQEQIQFSTYKGPISLGFSFSYPSAWTVTKKAIKTHLSEVIVASKDEPSTTAGLVVDSVKIDAIDNFGTPEIVGEKVLNFEKKKESVKDATIQSATAMSRNGLTYYLIDYTVDSTRGQKRYVAKATVTGNQLYVFTAQAKEDAFRGETADILSKMLDSFNVVKQYS